MTADRTASPSGRSLRAGLSYRKLPCGEAWNDALQSLMADYVRVIRRAKASLPSENTANVTEANTKAGMTASIMIGSYTVPVADIKHLPFWDSAKC